MDAAPDRLTWRNRHGHLYIIANVVFDKSIMASCKGVRVPKNDRSDDPFPGRLVQARELRKLSQTELAKKTGIPPSSISHFEAGMRKPSFDNLRRIATELAVSTDFLLGRVDKPELAAEADRLHRDAQRLNDQDRNLAQAFIEMLGNRAKKE